MKKKLYLFIFFFLMWIFFFEQARAGVITNATPISALLINISSYLLYVLGFLAIISLVISGIIYAVSAGDERIASRAKSAIKNSIIGIVIAATALIIVKGITMIIG